MKHNFPVIIFRPYQVFGPNQDLNRLIPIVISNCLKDKKFPCSEGKQYRDFLYIDDFIQAISKSFSFRHSGEILNIVYGKAYKIKEIIEHIRYDDSIHPELPRDICNKLNYKHSVILEPLVYWRKHNSQWSNSNRRILPNVISFYMKYFWQISPNLHIKMLKKIVRLFLNK